MASAVPSDYPNKLGRHAKHTGSTLSIDAWTHSRPHLPVVVQACASELTRARHIWSQVTANDAAEAFQADPAGPAYLQALSQIWMVALLLQASADLHGVAPGGLPHDQHAFAEASRQTMTRVLGEHLLRTVSKYHSKRHRQATMWPF